MVKSNLLGSGKTNREWEKTTEWVVGGGVGSTTMVNYMWWQRGRRGVGAMLLTYPSLTMSEKKEKVQSSPPPTSLLLNFIYFLNFKPYYLRRYIVRDEFVKLC
jgi:hypothetical protein